MGKDVGSEGEIEGREWRILSLQFSLGKPICLSTYLSVYLSACLCVCLPASPPVRLSNCLSACACMSVCVSACLPASLLASAFANKNRELAKLPNKLLSLAHLVQLLGFAQQSRSCSFHPTLAYTCLQHNL